MSIPLKDFRMALSEQTLAVLEAEAVAFGSDMQSVARDVLAAWGKRREHAYKVYARRIIANGSQPDLPGFGMEDDGMQRKGRK